MWRIFGGESFGRRLTEACIIDALAEKIADDIKKTASP